MPIGPMSGKVCVVTGGTSGIGEVVVRELALKGAQVALVGRTLERAQEAGRRTVAAAPGSEIFTAGGDLTAQAEVRRIADELGRRFSKIDVLVNNAGAVFTRRLETVDGIERTFALNVLAPFLLTSLLSEQLKSSGAGRVVNVSSAAHWGARLDLRDLQLKESYRGFRAYSRSKLALILLTHEFAKRFNPTEVTVNALHPGFVSTRFGQNNGGAFAIGIRIVSFVFGISAKRGARTPVFVASSPQLKKVSGAYFVRERATMSSAESYDDEMAQKLWDACQSLTNRAG